MATKDHEVDRNSNCKRTHDKIAIIYKIDFANVQIWMFDHAMEKKNRKMQN
jgi:hypothetical protein